MKLNPTEDRIVLKRDEPEEQAGKILIPDSAKEQPLTATVLVVGPGRMEDGKFIEPEIKVGDSVVVGKYSGMHITVEGEEVWIVRETDIVATLTPEP